MPEQTEDRYETALDIIQEEGREIARLKTLLAERDAEIKHLKTSLTPAPPAQTGIAERLYDAIEKVLQGHRLQHWYTDEDAGENVPLVDHLSPGDTIETGQQEIRLICDDIYNEVLVPMFSSPTPRGDRSPEDIAGNPDAVVTELIAAFMPHSEVPDVVRARICAKLNDQAYQIRDLQKSLVSSPGMSTKPENVDTSEKHVDETAKCIQEPNPNLCECAKIREEIMTHHKGALDPDARVYRAENGHYNACPCSIVSAYEIVQHQAEDEGLWFFAQTCAESYLQQELRKLHAAVERDAEQGQALTPIPPGNGEQTPVIAPVSTPEEMPTWLHRMIENARLPQQEQHVLVHNEAIAVLADQLTIHQQQVATLAHRDREIHRLTLKADYWVKQSSEASQRCVQHAKEKNKLRAQVQSLTTDRERLEKELAAADAIVQAYDDEFREDGLWREIDKYKAVRAVLSTPEKSHE
jgi:hypothetical protein